MMHSKYKYIHSRLEVIQSQTQTHLSEKPNQIDYSNARKEDRPENVYRDSNYKSFLGRLDGT